MRTRNTILALAGAAVLVLKSRYAGPLEPLVYSYAGNFAVSFGQYFVAALTMPPSPRGRASAAIGVLAAVTLFEVTDGFGVMANVYDAWDLAANTAGIGLAVVVDLITTRFVRRAGRSSFNIV